MTTPRSFAHYNVTEKIGAGQLGQMCAVFQNAGPVAGAMGAGNVEGI